MTPACKRRICYEYTGRRNSEVKKEKDAVILAHYYVNDEVQAIADYIGDSYYLAKVAVGLKEKTIVFAGVKFMGESAKILNPEKTVLMPDEKADCPMAHMAEIERIEEVRREYDDVAVVCYINSTAELKMHSDVCVTSANAMKIVKSLPNKNIFFIPDENLGRYIATKVPEKNFIFNDGYCHVHKNVTADMVKRAKESHLEAEVLIHPECTLDVLEYADYIGSTSGIIDYATNSDKKEFIISTELGVLYQLKQKNPDKTFYAAGSVQICPNMKKVTLEKVRNCLRDGTGVVEVSDEKMEKSLVPLKRMLELAK
ncbi:quinolinate synthetase A [Butyrivibrio fibrisolvens 16/4]|nr:quinolinate synthetase A [Butyrivibrio fibrisolvens 16/4]